MMLKSFQKSRNVHGTKVIVLANACNVARTTFDKWASGDQRCPIHRRQSVDRAFGEGAGVDWDAYDRECDQKKAETAQSRPKPAQSAAGAGWGAVGPETPKAPPAPPVVARDAATELWGDV